MITPEEFPYIKSLYVNDCYAYKDFNIELHDYKPFSHLILTGKNGSGKSTILKIVDNHVINLRDGNNPDLRINYYKHIIAGRISQCGEDETVEGYRSALFQFEAVIPSYKAEPSSFWPTKKGIAIYSYLKAKRNSQVSFVSTVTKEADFTNQLQANDSTETFTQQFKQYLVNKKVYQAFDQINKDLTRFTETDRFFIRLTESFRQIFEDKGLDLIFRQEDFEFFIQLSDGRKLTFGVLSEGFSALLSILMDLFMRVDLIRKQVGDYSYSPCGIVLIDEPETHLHLQLQEQVLPLLTSLFPNIQFIAATHSPAVIASIKNATIFDLTTKESRGSEETVGRSYSDLMMSHFGLNNEYSETADAIIRQVDQAIAEFGNDPARLREVLQPIYDVNSAYLSPTLKVKFELLMAEQEAKAVAHS